MLKLNASAFTRAVGILDRVQMFIKTHQEHGEKGLSPVSMVSRENKKGTKRHLDQLVEVIAPIGMPLTVKSIGRMKEGLRKKDYTMKDFSVAFLEIENRIYDELDLVTVFCLDGERAKYYEPLTPLFGQEVADRFPSSNYDIEEAGKCLALRRSTACVAHLMRAIEPALKGLAAALDVEFAHTNWHNALDQIEKAIRQRGSLPHKASWKADEQFYSEAAVHFRLLKDAWRNHAMHLRDRYDEERAITIFQNVRSFMRHLSGRLSEPVG